MFSIISSLSTNKSIKFFFEVGLLLSYTLANDKYCNRASLGKYDQNIFNCLEGMIDCLSNEIARYADDIII